MEFLYKPTSYYTALVLLLMSKEGFGITITVLNGCDHAVWPGITSNAGSAPLHSTGFELPPRAMTTFDVPPGWSGRFWGRTGCAFDPVTGQGSCMTGDCGSNQIECNGGGPQPPATLAEFTIGNGSQDFYDVSLVDGYNLPMLVEPVGGSGACGSTGCLTELNRLCPSELRVGDGQACKSACDAFGSPEYCCSGAYGSPAACRPSTYSATFKSACPRAYTYAYDDATSTFTCTRADYAIAFCPLLTSQKSSRDSSAAGEGRGTPPPPSDASSDAAHQDDLPWLPNLFSSSYPSIDPGLVLVAAAAAAAASLSLLLSSI